MDAGPLSRPRVRAATLAGAAGLVPAAAVVAITAVAAALRLWSLSSVAGNPFYDAAVRSMGQSWHNLFYGAFEPGGQVSIDKVPVDLWLQVLSVKLIGFGPLATRLPGVLAGVLAVPLLYDVVRRVFGRPAGLAAAAALAVLGSSVLTARSDTMDSLMMALDVFAAWLVVWGAQRRRSWPLVAAGAVIGLAFNVKLFEGLIVLPALGVLGMLAGALPWRRRALGLAGGLVAFIAVSLAWIAPASLAPLGKRPWPIGSTDGGVWNVVFGYNGLDRLRTKASPAALQLDPPGPLRLFTGGSHDYANLIGTTLVAALIFGVLALAFAGFTHRRGGGLERALAVFLGAWLVIGSVLLSAMQRPQPRYLEAFTPAVAGVFGAAVGLLIVQAGRTRAAAAALAIGAVACALVAPALVHAPAWATLLALAAAAGAVLTAISRWSAPLAACAVVAALAVPGAAALSIAQSTRSDAGLAAPLPPHRVRALSRFLLSHRGRAAYELASASVFKAGPLIVRDGLPVLMLTSYQGRPLLTPAQLHRLVAARRVRYVIVGRAHCPHGAAGCPAVVRWARAHSVDISRAAQLGPPGTLSEFTGR